MHKCNRTPHRGLTGVVIGGPRVPVTPLGNEKIDDNDDDDDDDDDDDNNNNNNNNNNKQLSRA